MELKLLLKNTSRLLFSKIITVILGFVKVKFAALLLGPEGLGAMNQFTFATTKISEFSLLSMNHGVVKLLSEKKNNENSRVLIINILKAYTIIISVITVVGVCLLLLFVEDLTQYFFGETKYQSLFLISVISVPILIFTSWSTSLLRSFKEIKYLARSEIIAAIISIAVFVPAIYYAKLLGAILAAAFLFLMLLILNYYFAKTKVLKYLLISIKDIKKGSVLSKDLKELLLFAGIGMSLGLYDIFSETLGRSLVIKSLGLTGIGLYSPIIALSGLFTGFLLPSLFTYLFPRFAESKSDFEISGVLNDTFRMISFIATPFVLFIIALKNQIIPLLYTNEFHDAIKLLPGHMIGTLFFLYMVTMGQVFSPTGRLKVYGIMQFFIISINLLVVVYFVPSFGLVGYMLKFIITPVIFFFIFLYYLTKSINFQIKKHNLILMLYTLLTSCIVTFMGIYTEYLGVILSIIFVGCLFYFLSKHEKQFMISRVTAIINKF